MYNSIQAMFTSATLKLTAWYLLGVMLLSIGFSVLVYNLSVGEFTARLGVIETRLRENEFGVPAEFDFSTVRTRQLNEARHNIITVLLYTNLIILGVGGVASYAWARRTLRPIEEAHEAQSRFTSDASHELRTPLAIMQTEIESVLRDSSAKKSLYKETLESNLEEVNRLSKLANLLLKIAQLDTASLTWQTVDIIDAASQAVQSFSQSQQARIKLVAPKKLFIHHANPESLTELIIILIDNALKYSNPNTRITLTLYREKGRTCCNVTNEGKGIEPKDINCIFRRFYQADTSRNTTTAAGYGLGLSLAQKIVELHRGDISVKSIPHQTTTFTVRLP